MQTTSKIFSVPCKKRSLFFFAFPGADECGKRDLCHWSKFAVLSMHGGYLATESSRDTSCCVGSLNNSGSTVKECAGQRGLKSQSTNISWCIRLWTAVGSKRVWTHGRGRSLSRTRQPSERKRKDTSGSTEYIDDITVMAAQGYEFYLRVLKVSRSLVRDTFSTIR